jgi:sorting nexin-1/2
LFVFIPNITFETLGCILPPLPDKQMVGKFSNEFIEGRKRALERYLLRVVAHPELSSSTVFITFLQADDGAFARAKEDAKASKPKLAATAASWFEGTVNSLSGTKVSFLSIIIIIISNNIILTKNK